MRLVSHSRIAVLRRIEGCHIGKADQGLIPGDIKPYVAYYVKYKREYKKRVGIPKRYHHMGVSRGRGQSGSGSVGVRGQSGSALKGSVGSVGVSP